MLKKNIKEKIHSGTLETNKKRVEEENKDIPVAIINNMMSSYETPAKSEGFDEIVSSRLTAFLALVCNAESSRF